MSKSKATDHEVKYVTAWLIRSKALAGYQQDFVRVILTKPEYTIAEAKAAIEAVLEKE